MNNLVKGYALALVSIFVWSIHAVIIRYLVLDNNISPFLVSFMRFFLGGIFLILVFVLLNKSKLDSVKTDLKTILTDKTIWLSSFFLFLNFFVFHLGLKYTFTSNSIIIESLSPVAVIIITLLFFQKKITSNFSNIRKMFFITLFVTIGIALLINNTGTTVDGDYKIWGDILSFFAMIFFAIFIILNSSLRNKFSKINGLLITGIGLLIGSIFMFSFAIPYFSSLFLLNSSQIFLFLLLGIGSTGIGYLTWFMASKYLSHITLALLINSIGITTIITEFIIYKDNGLIGWKLILGTIIILGASVYTELLNKK